MTALYLDVSNHDRSRRGRPLDWPAIAAAGLGGVMCAKASEGDPLGRGWYHDPWFEEMQTGARDAGYTVRGGYHVLVAGDDASIARQVDALQQRLDAHGCVWGMLDVEPFGYLLEAGIAPRWTDVLRFVARWLEVDDRVLAVYLPRWVWERPPSQGGMDRADLTELPGPLVASNYPSATGSSPAEHYTAAGGDQGPGWAAYGGRTPDIWQYTSQASVSGASSRTDLNAFRGSLTALAALLDPTGGHMATERTLPHEIVRQSTPYYCGPAAIRIALTTRGIYVSQDELAKKAKTTTAGTNSVTDIDRVIDAYINPNRNDFEPVFVWGNDVTPAEAKAFKANIVKSIDAGYGVVVNVVKTGRDVSGNTYTYNGGHYVAVVGYRKGGDEMLVADPAFGGRYWMRTTDLDTWMAARGYVWAAHVPAEPAPVPPAKVGPGAAFPLPAGHYYGLKSGPAESHGGFYANEQPVVKAIQKIVGVKDDGDFGPKTEAAVKAWQKAHGLVADGRVGPVTWSAMFPAKVEPQPEPPVEQPEQPEQEQPAEPEPPAEQPEEPTPPTTVDLTGVMAALQRIEAKVDQAADVELTDEDRAVFTGLVQEAVASVLLAQAQGGAAALAAIAGGGE